MEDETAQRVEDAIGDVLIEAACGWTAGRAWAEERREARSGGGGWEGGGSGFADGVSLGQSGGRAHVWPLSEGRAGQRGTHEPRMRTRATHAHTCRAVPRMRTRAAHAHTRTTHAHADADADAARGGCGGGGVGVGSGEWGVGRCTDEARGRCSTSTCGLVMSARASWMMRRSVEVSRSCHSEEMASPPTCACAALSASFTLTLRPPSRARAVSATVVCSHWR